MLVRCLLHSGATRRLFGFLNMREPRDWRRLASDAISRCDELVYRAVATPPSIETIRLLDDISDTVCQAYDTAEFCRNVHSCSEWQEAATRACVTVGGYVEQLNTNSSLYRLLVRALDEHDRSAAACSVSQQDSPIRTQPLHSGFTAEALYVGRSLRQDFEKAGIHLPDDKRTQLTHLIGLQRHIGMAIGQNLSDPSKLGHVDINMSGALQPRPASGDQSSSGRRLTQAMASQSSGGRRLTLDSTALHTLLQTEKDAKLREKVYMTGYSTPLENVALLQRLVEVRQEMAELMGARSYAHYALGGGSTLAGSPEAVQSFLQELAAAIRPQMEEDRKLLQLYKGRHVGTPAGATHLDTWDRLYYMANARIFECPLDHQGAAVFFHLQRCIDSFGQLLTSLLGIKLVRVALEPGEAWADDIQKVTLVNEEEGLLGTIYLDLHPRRGKVGGASHFTLRGGRRLSDGSYQAPCVAMVCSFHTTSSGLLSPDQAQTLFHEFGHALHSVLSRTEYQHHSGTRGPMDLMEVPSHVTERFATTPGTMRMLLQHHISGRPMPLPMAQQLHRHLHLFQALALHQQIVDAMIDQRLHGVGAAGRSISDTVQEVMEEHSVFPFVPGTCPQARFYHLVGYGATYYSYLYAQALSSTIWQDHIYAGGINHKTGSHIRRNMLQCGSAREPRHYVTGILGEGHLQPVNGGFKPKICSLLKELGAE